MDILDRINHHFRGTTMYEGRKPTLLEEAGAEIESLRARLAKETRRLDWFVENTGRTGSMAHSPRLGWWFNFYEKFCQHTNAKPTYREAIDAAMSSSEGEG